MGTHGAEAQSQHQTFPWNVAYRLLMFYLPIVPTEQKFTKSTTLIDDSPFMIAYNFSFTTCFNGRYIIKHLYPF